MPFPDDEAYTDARPTRHHRLACLRCPSPATTQCGSYRGRWRRRKLSLSRVLPPSCATRPSRWGEMGRSRGERGRKRGWEAVGVPAKHATRRSHARTRKPRTLHSFLPPLLSLPRSRHPHNLLPTPHPTPPHPNADRATCLKDFWHARSDMPKKPRIAPCYTENELLY